MSWKTLSKVKYCLIRADMDQYYTRRGSHVKMAKLIAFDDDDDDGDNDDDDTLYIQ